MVCDDFSMAAWVVIDILLIIIFLMLLVSAIKQRQIRDSYNRQRDELIRQHEEFRESERQRINQILGGYALQKFMERP